MNSTVSARPTALQKIKQHGSHLFVRFASFFIPFWSLSATAKEVRMAVLQAAAAAAVPE